MSGPPMKGPYDPDRIRERVARAGDGTMRDAPDPVPPYNDDRGDLQEAWVRGYRAALAARSEAGAEGLDVLDELRDWSHSHAALIAGGGSVDDIDGFIEWARAALAETEPRDPYLDLDGDREAQRTETEPKP